MLENSFQFLLALQIKTAQTTHSTLTQSFTTLVGTEMPNVNKLGWFIFHPLRGWKQANTGKVKIQCVGKIVHFHLVSPLTSPLNPQILQELVKMLIY